MCYTLRNVIFFNLGEYCSNVSFGHRYMYILGVFLLFSIEDFLVYITFDKKASK